MPQPHGGAIRVGGNPGNKGGTGRPRKAWKEFCKQAIESEAVQAAVLKKAERGYTPMVKLLADHGEGAPEQRITLQADTGALDRLFARLAPTTDPRALPDATLERLPAPLPPVPDSRDP